MRVPRVALACGLLLACTTAPLTTADAGSPDDATFPAVAATQWGPFEDWASPIDDYIAVGQAVQPQVNKAIDDLITFKGWLWLGYGDGTYNLGEDIPIEFRSFGAASDPAIQRGPGDI